MRLGIRGQTGRGAVKDACSVDSVATSFRLVGSLLLFELTSLPLVFSCPYYWPILVVLREVASQTMIAEDNNDAHCLHSIHIPVVMADTDDAAYTQPKAIVAATGGAGDFITGHGEISNIALPWT